MSGSSVSRFAPEVARPSVVEPWTPGVFIVPVLVVASIVAWTVAGAPLTASSTRLGAWLAVWIAICVQAVPFLVLGVVVSGVLTAFVSPTALRAIVPRQPQAAVVAAGVSGVVLPGCECASVPVSRSLINAGVPSAAALTFLLAAPAVNPVVLISTAVAFPNQPMMVVARFVASMLAAWIVGWLWIVRGNDRWLRRLGGGAHHDQGSRWRVFVQTASHDFLHAGGFLVLGGAVAATINVLLPRPILDALAAQPVLAVLALALLAVLVAICSEADAFVAASMTSFSPVAQLAFMTVGPMVDVKLISMQTGTFGGGFAARFAPVTFVVALGAAALVGWVML